MIDPNLEAGTSNSGNIGGVNNSAHDTMTEAETLNETILKALKQSDESMR